VIKLINKSLFERCDIMQFLVIAYDGNDEGALERRLAAREAHLKATAQMKAEGKTLFAGALLDENEKMIGSAVVVDFPSREEIDKWLEVEPYIINNVWKKVEIKPYKVAGIFMEPNK
jgi:uncharacterized protein YciI